MFLKEKSSHVAGSEYVFEYVNYEVMLIDEKYIVINRYNTKCHIYYINK